MVPKICKNEIVRIVREQESRRILYVSDKSVASEALQHDLSLELQLSGIQLHCYGGEEINDVWDMVIVSDAVLIKEGFEAILKELLLYVRHSILVVSPVYLDVHDQADSFLGRRWLYPTRFVEFDFTFKEYEAEFRWQIYVFYPFTERMHVDIDSRMLRSYKGNSEKKWNVLYALPHLKLTGGMKCLLLHASSLFRRGHDVYLVYDGINDAIPQWSDLKEGKDFTGQLFVSEGRNLLSEIYEKKIDVIIVGLYFQMETFMLSGVPVLYWEQGHELLFGNCVVHDLQCSNSSALEVMRDDYQTPVTIAANSTIIARILETRFGRSPFLLYTGIDVDLYKPYEGGIVKELTAVPKIILVGNPYLPFKGFQVLLNVLEQIWRKGYRFSVTWASQHNVDVSVSFPLDLRVQVPQKELAALYRTHDIYIGNSLFEASPMPPMEAMASGIAVVATDCGGIMTYAKPGENMLLAEQGNPQELMQAIEYLITNPQARKILAENGRKTALEYSVDKAIDQLEDILYSIISFANNDGQKQDEE